MRGFGLNDVMAWLEATKKHGMALGLKHTKRVLDRLQLPHRPAHILHVAGSNGKGTVCALMAGSLTISNIPNLLFSSPHLIRVEERIRVNGVPVGSEQFERALLAVHSASIVYPEVRLTFFEVTYLAAMQCASDSKVDVLIIETGLGGRKDATRSGPATASLVTSISTEHRDILGDDLAQIAREKAAIARPGCPILLRKPGDALIEQAMLDVVAMAGQSELGETPGKAFETFVTIDESTSVRREALVLADALFAAVGLPRDSLETAYSQVNWPARFQDISSQSSGSHPYLLDAAHNPSGLQRVLAQLEQRIKATSENGGQGWSLLFGTSPQHDLATFCQPLMSLCARYPPRTIVLTEPQGGRYPAVPNATLHALTWPCSTVTAIALPSDAVEYFSTQTPENVGLIISLGSLYLQGNLLECFGHTSGEHLSLLAKQ